MCINVVPTWRTSRRACCLISRNSTRFYHERRWDILAEKDKDVNAFVCVSPKSSTGVAKALPLSGLTVALKDNIASKSLPTTCSSSMLENFTSPFDATVVRLLQNAGSDIVGKTNCDEFGMGSLNVHSIHGPVVNPVDTSQRRSAGGSSGGSAAAVAAGMCDAALGTDTGGSVRLPASYCGVVGLKPSYGLISRLGVISYADSLDCVGVLAMNVDTVGRVFDVISQYDHLDPTSAPPDIRDQALKQTSKRCSLANSILSGLRIGIPQEYFPAELSPEIIAPFRAVVQNLKAQGATIVPVSLPSTPHALASYYVLASAEASSNLARYDGIQFGLHVHPPPGTDISKTSNVYAHARTLGFGSEVQKRILLGTYALSADAFDNYFLQAQRVRQLIRDDFDRVFSIPNHFAVPPPPPSKELILLDASSNSNSPDLDVLLHPSAIRTAPPLRESEAEQNSDLSAYVQDVLTVPASLAGLPALSVPLFRPPAGGDNKNTKWPIGISVVGQWGTDAMVLAVGKAISNSVEGPSGGKGFETLMS